ncbi:ankyrin repeat domain-containing protein [Archangium violaceum]|uniref:ankyrin repeat domain-containing protein n=1 Tax=Archangium violaceum TaxID=83451 RepID=UPI0036DD7852
MVALETALDVFYTGDVAALERLLRTEPSLLHARVTSAEGPYCGYFHEATLLHHVAGNPLIRPLPATTAELARLLLELGAEADAATRQGPAQPHDIGWSTLGLVATSDAARQAGHQRPLLELLLARGADIDFRNGGPLVGALYYGEAEAARFLVERGARYDLVTAAGLGRIDLMERFVRDDGTLAPDAHALVHYSQVRDRPASRADILGLALIFASRSGHRDAAAWLIDHGASVRTRPPFDHLATPLHWAALHGHTGVASLLLDRGADRTVCDTSFNATPQGWAEHAGHQAVAALVAI